MMRDDLYWFWFCGLDKVGIRSKHKLLKIFGDARAIYGVSQKVFERFDWMRRAMIDELMASKNMDQIKKSMDIYYRKGFHFAHIYSPEYPQRLKNIYEYPIGLYYKGRLPDDLIPSVAIVGARSCSLQGKAQAVHFSEVLAKAGIQIISGMALGIDGSAHRGAMAVDGRTYAVLGSGIDVCYPLENWEIYSHIANLGGCMTEYAPGAKPVPWRFPMRNRIISGLADLVLIVEARQKSGALITADYALDQGKDVFVVSGDSAGCQALVDAGAESVSSPDELIKNWGLNLVNSKKNNILLDKSEKLVYSSLCLNPKNIEDICSELQMNIKEGFSALHALERKGLIRQIHKNYYVLK